MLFLSCTIILTIVGIIALAVYIQPRFIIKYLSKRNRDVIFRFNTCKKIIALTIDDVPTENTKNVLDVLKKYNVKATFFVIGSQIEGNEHILQRIRDEGHELGNHTWENKTSLFLNSADLRNQIRNVDTLIHGDSKPKIKWFRPGFGYYNARLLRVVKKCGYFTVLGDVYCHDYYIPLPTLNSFFITQRVRSGSIIILHDLDHSVVTLETILPKLKQDGYTLTTLTGLAFSRTVNTV
jgi:peptidoglycan/xylan/chitin deacetylase (PgdA/CDA1 family)